MAGLGLIATGVQIHNRITGEDFGLHQDCHERLMASLPAEVTHPFTGSVTTIGPLFGGRWQCAYAECLHSA